MASKRPRRSDLTSNLKFEAQTIYDTTFILTVWASAHSFLIKIKIKNRPLLELLALALLQLKSM